MGVEGRDLIDLGLRHAQLVRQRHQMRGGDVAVPVLDEMQELDQEIAPSLRGTEQRAYLGPRGRSKLPALGHSPALAPARPRMARLLRGGMSFRHQNSIGKLRPMIRSRRGPYNKGIAYRDRTNLLNCRLRHQSSYRDI